MGTRLLVLSLYYPPARAYGGPIASLARTVEELQRIGLKCTVLTTNADGGRRLPVTRTTRDGGAMVVYDRVLAGEFIAPATLARMVASLARCDAVYVWGIMVWYLPVLLTALFAFRRVPLFVSTRGMLFPPALSRHRSGKLMFLRVLRLLGLERRARFHVTSQEESTSVMEQFPAARLVHIPNGVDIDAAVPATDEKTRYFIFLGRINPIKRIDLLLRSFSKFCAESERGACRLVIAGSGEVEYMNQLRQLASDLNIRDQIVFVGHVEGMRKAELVTHARALVLCSASENFGMSAAEALAAGTPVIATSTTPWGRLEEKGCGWFVDSAESALAVAMSSAMSMTVEMRQQMGARAIAWMREDFSWSSVGRQLANAIEAEILPVAGSVRATKE